ncbi:MAG: hypothetical protein ACK5QQ_06345 [Cyanobacteriota bacterium]
MLNWRRDPDYEQRKMQHEVRMKQLENEILRVRNDSEQIKKETERLRRENAREKVLSALIKQHCFPPESSSHPPQQTEPDCGPSLP